MLAGYRFALTLCLLPLVSHAANLSDAEIVSQIMAGAKPLASDVTYYHWTTPQAARRLDEAGTFTGPTFEHYISLSEKNALGGGIYVAPNPWVRADYFFSKKYLDTYAIESALERNDKAAIDRLLEENGGELVEVTVPKGTLEVSSWHIPKGITKADIDRLKIQVVFVYGPDGDRVIKVPGAALKRFSAGTHTVKELCEIYLNLKHPNGNVTSYGKSKTDPLVARWFLQEHLGPALRTEEARDPVAFKAHGNQILEDYGTFYTPKAPKDKPAAPSVSVVRQSIMEKLRKALGCK
jgi:hypothetical protein